MYQSALPEPSETFKINLFGRIVDVFKLTLLTIFTNSTIMKSSDYTSDLFQRRQLFPSKWVNKAGLTPSDM